MQNKINLSIVIPTYNEKENIQNLIEEIYSVLKKNSLRANILVVDDNSPDNTSLIVKKLPKKYNTKIILRKKDRGYGNSIKEGINQALKLKSRIIITMDSDFSHSPSVIPAMVKEIDKGYDVVIGSRRVSGGKIIGWNLWRHLCSVGAGLFSRLMLGIKTKDLTSGFRAYKAQIFLDFDLRKIKSNGYSFLEELIYIIEQRKNRIKEIPITFLDRKHGKSKLSNIEIFKFFMTILRLKFSHIENSNNWSIFCSEFSVCAILFLCVIINRIAHITK